MKFLTPIKYRTSRHGMALVLTLILLSVTLIMALAFMAISRRESSTVTTAADIATARNAADTALNAAEAQIMANILANTNSYYNLGLLVSTNTDYPSDNFSSPADYTNLLINPRPPVFISQNGVNDFRFYLDLNRNGRFETNGNVVDVPNTNIIFEVGDPEWNGILANPGFHHDPNNQFISRFAFIALPIGDTLDLNYIHNQTLNQNLSDGFFRNEGVGSWEINLAAFLTDLNTNTPWVNYKYLATSGFANSGQAFDDAKSILAYRYANNYNTLASVQNLYGANGATAFQNDNIDGYSDGPWMTNNLLPPDNNITDDPTKPWAGADNTNHFFNLLSDLFDTNKSSIQFVNNLTSPGNTNSTYDRYTFYRMLSQLGTESSAESGKMNLNYRNVTNGVVIADMETNFYAWTPLEFFNNAADRMLRAYSAQWRAENLGNYTNTFGASTTNVFGITNIPVYVGGQFVYTPAVNRLLQLAANIYDATANNSTNGSPDYPDVFRPLFTLVGTDIYITGYTNVINNGILNTVSGPNDPQLSVPTNAAAISALGSIPANLNIYGVPWIIGAKKGFPNFNEFSMQTSLGVSRRLQFLRMTNSGRPVVYATNQMYTMNLNSWLGVELWNSYSASYPRTVVIGVNDIATTTITNDDGAARSWVIGYATNSLYSINGWQGAAPWYGGKPNSSSFLVLNLGGPGLPNSVYRSPFATGAALGIPAPIITPPGFTPTNAFTGIVPFESTSTDGNGYYFPQFGLLFTNQLQLFMLDLSNSVYHVIDYVHFEGPSTYYNVNSNLFTDNANNIFNGVWKTNYQQGIQSQITISKGGSIPPQDGQWNADPQAATLGTTKQQQQSAFISFFNSITAYQPLSIQAPYSPTRYIVQYLTWQANDPLVHYLKTDIDYTYGQNSSQNPAPGLSTLNGGNNFNISTNANLGQLNDRFAPWGGYPPNVAQGNSPSSIDYNTAIKDSKINDSDSWDFPTNRFPTTGWIGRVHRGTPWQTVYLKSSSIDNNTWNNWTGNFNTYDDAHSQPVSDRLLFDIFTTAFNDNATHGQLSVNQSGLAAWSALLSGVTVITNDAGMGAFQPMVISPAGAYDPANPPALAQIWNGINSTRNSQPGRVFKHVGDILNTPQLTEQSPFILDNTNTLSPASTAYPNDEVMEWLPQQIMSLLNLGSPRYVIYSYGQTLKPSPGGVDTSGRTPFGTVTNYQIVAEHATRAVVRFDSVTNNPASTNAAYRAVIESYNVLPPD